MVFMRVQINPIVIDGQTCSEVEVSVAVSNSTAIRAVPVDANGTEYPTSPISVVGRQGTPDIDTFMNTVAQAVHTLLAGRGH
jgi:hypothetical protein